MSRRARLQGPISRGSCGASNYRPFRYQFFLFLGVVGLTGSASENLQYEWLLIDSVASLLVTI